MGRWKTTFNISIIACLYPQSALGGVDAQKTIPEAYSVTTQTNKTFYTARDKSFLKFSFKLSITQTTKYFPVLIIT